MSKQQSVVAASLEDQFQNWGRLIIAAVLFASGLVLASPSTFGVTSLSSYLNINTLFVQFVGGALTLSGFFVANVKGHFSLALRTAVTNLKNIAEAGVIWTIGMFFIGVGNTQGFTPVGIIANLIGYALLLVSLVVSGQLALALSAK